MKQLFTILSLFLSFCFATAKQIDENKAKQVGQNFLSSISTSPILNSTSSLELVYTNSSTMMGQSLAKKPLNYFYVFNTNTNGFILISADDIVTPILGYSDQGNFDVNNIPVTVAKWFEGYKNQIRYAIENHVKTTEEITKQWEELISGKASENPSIASAGVNPLLKTTWNQSPYYNTLCPYDNSAKERTVSGCVATAMTQIMKYWSYPATGSGFHSYSHSKYGTLSANFGSTNYDWSAMPNNVTSNNNAVATLMYQVGVSVDMNYGIASIGGSGAYVISSQSPVTHCSEYALKQYFGYKSSLKGVERVNYNETQWMSLLKTELDASRPILYAGFGNGGGHCFVADGYDNNNYIHFNWGWGGAYDGYFQINALNPSGTGTGGGSGGYNSGHQAVIGIEPPTGTQTFDLELYDDVTPSYTKIGYGQGFLVRTNIANSGTNTFSGDYAAAAFDKDYNFIDFIETLSGYTLKGGFAYTNNLEFTTTGLLSMLPGKYYIGIFYRPTGGNWVQVSDGNYSNLTSMTVVHANDIELNSNMVLTPGNTFTQGKPATVNLNFINNGNVTFKGDYALALYNLDGSFAQIINSYTETTGLPKGYTYQSPYITFTTPSITVVPGTYLLAAQHNYNNTGWQLSGSTNFLNPIKITVVAPAIIPDKYETNDVVGQSYNLPVSFNGNTAKVYSDGSNCHITSDNDFYKVVLPSGFNYTIIPRIHDATSSGNGNVYSLDALFSYSTDGINWSEAYDDVIPGNIKTNGATTLYFHVAPFFSGGTGSYLLDLIVTRVSTASIEDEVNSFIKIYPNPSKDKIYIEFDNSKGEINNINVLNMQGQNVYSVSEFNTGNKIELQLTDLPTGMYFIQLQTSNGLITKKIILEK